MENVKTFKEFINEKYDAENYYNYAQYLRKLLNDHLDNKTFFDSRSLEIMQESFSSISKWNIFTNGETIPGYEPIRDFQYYYKISGAISSAFGLLDSGKKISWPSATKYINDEVEKMWRGDRQKATKTKNITAAIIQAAKDVAKIERTKLVELIKNDGSTVNELNEKKIDNNFFVKNLSEILGEISKNGKDPDPDYILSFLPKKYYKEIDDFLTSLDSEYDDTWDDDAFDQKYAFFVKLFKDNNISIPGFSFKQIKI